MKKLWFKLISKTCSIVAKLISYVHAPWTYRNINYQDVIDAKNILKPGDIILTRKLGDLSTLVIPGFWKHAAIYIGCGRIVDATKAGVTIRHIPDLMMNSDNIVIMRVNTDIGKSISEYAISQVGKEYDYEMKLGNLDSLFCSELVYLAINQVLVGYLEFRERMGIQTFTPNDCYMATKKFHILYEKRKK